MKTMKSLFEEFDYYLMNFNRPSEYFNRLLKTGLLYDEYPLTLLGDLDSIQQSPNHHPEGSVWNHTMLVIDIASGVKELSSAPNEFMWAALLHDVGKIVTTRVINGKTTSYNHDKYGKKMAEEFIGHFSNDKFFIREISLLIKWHMQVLYHLKNLPMADFSSMLKEVKINEVVLLTLCDRLGRGKMTPEKAKEEYCNIDKFLEKYNSYVNKYKNHKYN